MLCSIKLKHLGDFNCTFKNNNSLLFCFILSIIDTAFAIMSGHVDLMIHVCVLKVNRERSEDTASVLFRASTCIYLLAVSLGVSHVRSLLGPLVKYDCIKFNS